MLRLQAHLYKVHRVHPCPWLVDLLGRLLLALLALSPLLALGHTPVLVSRDTMRHPGTFLVRCRVASSLHSNISYCATVGKMSSEEVLQHGMDERQCQQHGGIDGDGQAAFGNLAY